MDRFLSDRINTLPSSATFAMAQQASALKKQGYDVINLSLGEPSFKTPRYIQQAAKQAIDTEAYFGYPPVAGYADLRAAIAQKLYRDNQLRYSPEQIVVSTGAKQALTNVFLCLLNPGDEVIVYTPYWGSYTAIIQLAEGKPVLVKGRQEANFAVTPAQLENAITPQTKAVLFSSPCNPTGLVLSKQALLEMATVLAAYPAIFVVADEIYEYINFTAAPTSIGALEGMQDRVITINGFSKGFAMTGWRVGYLAAPVWLAKACEKLQGQTTAATCAIAQRAALAAIEGDKALIAPMSHAYLKRRNLAMQLLREIPGVRFCPPGGGFYLFPDISYYFGQTDGKTRIQNVTDFCMYLLKEGAIALTAGSEFGEPRCIRLSYAASEAQLTEGIQRIKKLLARLSNA